MSILNYNTIVQTSNLVMPEDLNPRGSLFGGKIMAEMDKTGAMAAMRYCGLNVVTVHVSEIDFKDPIHLGDMYTIYAELESVGNTSLNIKVTIEAEDLLAPVNEHNPRVAAKANYVFVAINENGQKTKVTKRGS